MMGYLDLEGIRLRCDLLNSDKGTYVLPESLDFVTLSTWKKILMKRDYYTIIFKVLGHRAKYSPDSEGDGPCELLQIFVL